MYRISFYFLAITFISCITLSVATLPISTLPSSVIRDIRQRIRSKGCNANVCFAIDGSGSVSEKQFKYSTQFVQDIVNVLADDPKTEYAAFQYGYFARPIFRLTSDRKFVVTKLEYARAGNDRRTSMGSGIFFCSATLSSRRGEPNKIVVISDGRNNIGGDPIRQADFFKRRDNNGRVCSVVVGKNPDLSILKTISDYPVLTVNDYVELGFRITDLVEMVCGMK